MCEEVEREKKDIDINIQKCRLCPRACLADRTKWKGYCQATEKVRLARAALHFMEEPCISGKAGSGTIFFSGCNLRCCFCQNYRISHEGFGKDISIKRLSEIFLELQQKGANNINLVTATAYVPMIIKALDLIKKKLKIPVVYNCSGYDSIDTLRLLENYIDIYLVDLKYYDEELSNKYSGAKDYFKVASVGVKEMIRQVGKPIFDRKDMDVIDNGLLKKGVIIRHLVLPGARKDSIKILNWISKNLDSSSYLISLMSQYTPCYHASKYKEINRLLTSFEYDSVVKEAIKLGITNGYIQEKESASDQYTPDFNLDGC